MIKIGHVDMFSCAGLLFVSSLRSQTAARTGHLGRMCLTSWCRYLTLAVNEYTSCACAWSILSCSAFSDRSQVHVKSEWLWPVYTKYPQCHDSLVGNWLKNFHTGGFLQMSKAWCICPLHEVSFTLCCIDYCGTKWPPEMIVNLLYILMHLSLRRSALRTPMPVHVQ